MIRRYSKELGIVDRFMLTVNSLGFGPIILAGGAPRDIWLGREVNDWDFYLHTPFELDHDTVLTRIGLGEYKEITPDITEDKKAAYASMGCLVNVYEAVSEGMLFQIMFCDSPVTEDLLNAEFGASTSKIYYSEGIFNPSPEFLFSVENKTLYLRDVTVGSKFWKKTIEKFPDFEKKDVRMLTMDIGNSYLKGDV
jgi:hypothetical protein